jgi:hypothetical protein
MKHANALSAAVRETDTVDAIARTSDAVGSFGKPSVDGLSLGTVPQAA